MKTSRECKRGKNLDRDVQRWVLACTDVDIITYSASGSSPLLVNHVARFVYASRNYKRNRH